MAIMVSCVQMLHAIATHLQQEQSRVASYWPVLLWGGMRIAGRQGPQLGCRLVMHNGLMEGVVVGAQTAWKRGTRTTSR